MWIPWKCKWIVTIWNYYLWKRKYYPISVRRFKSNHRKENQDSLFQQRETNTSICILQALWGSPKSGSFLENAYGVCAEFSPFRCRYTVGRSSLVSPREPSSVVAQSSRVVSSLIAKRIWIRCIPILACMPYACLSPCTAHTNRAINITRVYSKFIPRI